jgi:hypothetical protein
LSNRDKITKGLSDALGFAKGADNGERITIYSTSEFFIGGVRFNAGRYALTRLPDDKQTDEPAF